MQLANGTGENWRLDSAFHTFRSVLVVGQTHDLGFTDVEPGQTKRPTAITSNANKRAKSRREGAADSVETDKNRQKQTKTGSGGEWQRRPREFNLILNETITK